MIQMLFHHKYYRLLFVCFAFFSLIALINISISPNNPYQLTDPDPTFYYAALNSIRYNRVTTAFEVFDSICWPVTITCLITGILFLINIRYIKAFLISYTMLYQTLLIWLFAELKNFIMPWQGKFDWQAYLLFFVSIICSSIVWYGYKELTRSTIENISKVTLFSKTKLIIGILSIGTLILNVLIMTPPLTNFNLLVYITEFNYPDILLLYSLTLVITLILIHKSPVFNLWFKGTLTNLYLLYFIGFSSPETLFNIKNGLLFMLSLLTLILAWRLSDTFAGRNTYIRYHS